MLSIGEQFLFDNTKVSWNWRTKNRNPREWCKETDDYKHCISRVCSVTFDKKRMPSTEFTVVIMERGMGEKRISTVGVYDKRADSFV